MALAAVCTSWPGPLASTEAARSGAAPEAAGAAAGGDAAAAAPASGRPRLSPIVITNISCRITASFRRLTRGSLVVVARILAARKVRKELVDQGLDDDGRLRELQLTAGLQEGFRTAGRYGDVIGAEQPGGLDRRIAVVRNMVIVAIDRQCHRRPVYRHVVADRAYLANPHSRHRYRCPDFQTADIIKFCGYSVTLRCPL